MYFRPEKKLRLVGLLVKLLHLGIEINLFMSSVSYVVTSRYRNMFFMSEQQPENMDWAVSVY